MNKSFQFSFQFFNFLCEKKGRIFWSDHLINGKLLAHSSSFTDFIENIGEARGQICLSKKEI